MLPWIPLLLDGRGTCVSILDTLPLRCDLHLIVPCGWCDQMALGYRPRDHLGVVAVLYRVHLYILADAGQDLSSCDTLTKSLAYMGYEVVSDAGRISFNSSKL